MEIQDHPKLKGKKMFYFTGSRRLSIATIKHICDRNRTLVLLELKNVSIISFMSLGSCGKLCVFSDFLPTHVSILLYSSLIN